MKEIQIPRKNLARSSDPGTKRINDFEMKNRKVTEKRQSASFSDLSVESTKVPMDFTQISDSEAESIVIQGSSIDLLAMPEICLLPDESPVSTISNAKTHIDESSGDRIRSIAELPASVQSLHVEINELKQLIYSVNTVRK